MANGDGAFLAPWKVIGLSITASIGISGIAMSVMSDRITSQSKMLGALSTEMNKGNRYTEEDARRDFGVVKRRFDRVEARDQRCEARMNEHVANHK